MATEPGATYLFLVTQKLLAVNKIHAARTSLTVRSPTLVDCCCCCCCCCITYRTTSSAVVRAPESVTEKKVSYSRVSQSQGRLPGVRMCGKSCSSCAVSIFLRTARRITRRLFSSKLPAQSTSKHRSHTSNADSSSGEQPLPSKRGWMDRTALRRARISRTSCLSRTHCARRAGGASGAGDRRR